MAKVSLAGIHYPDTTGDFGITDATDPSDERGWFVEGQRLYIANHYRAAAEMVVRWVLSESRHCNVEIAEWFPDDRQTTTAHSPQCWDAEARGSEQAGKGNRLATHAVPRIATRG